MLIYVARRDWSHIFGLACIEELPTAHLAVASMFPRLRNDVAFASVFAVTRLLFHFTTIFLYSTPYGQAHGTGNAVTILPPALFCWSIPLHVWWFWNTIKGIQRRRRALKDLAKTVCRVRHARADARSTSDRPSSPLVRSLSSHLSAVSSPVSSARCARSSDLARCDRHVRRSAQYRRIYPDARRHRPSRSLERGRAALGSPWISSGCEQVDPSAPSMRQSPRRSRRCGDGSPSTARPSRLDNVPLYSLM